MRPDNHILHANVIPPSFFLLFSSEPLHSPSSYSLGFFRQNPSPLKKKLAQAKKRFPQTRLDIACRGELFGLRWQNVDIRKSRVRLVTRKGKDGSLGSDWLPLADDLFRALLSHKQECVNREWVFPNPKTEITYLERNKWMRRLYRIAGVKESGLMQSAM